MSLEKKLQRRISELQDKETKLRSALDDKVGNQETLAADLKSTQIQLKKLRQQLLGTQKSLS